MHQNKQRIKIAEGDRFGRLVLICRAPTISHRNSRWICLCDCGNEKNVGQGELTSGKTKSCGCLRRELTAKNKTKHGNAKRGQHSKEYRIWRGILTRCLNPNNISYEDYGGRGITVCEEWVNSFDTFLADMGKCPDGMSIDRISNNCGYFKENCRWATPVEQARNRRKRRWKKKP